MEWDANVKAGRYIDIDLSGRRFDRWTVIRRSADGARRWDCVCDCGTESAVFGANLRRRLSLSCGCFRSERISETSTTHGLTKTVEYKTWAGIKNRCGNANHASFKKYGARGISICDRWSDSFENFLADMGPKPSSSHSIDRIDTNGNYGPGNCRWATKKEQAVNRNNTNFITFNGETLCMKDWARRLGMNYQSLVNRIIRRGWSIERALTEPIRQMRR